MYITLRHTIYYVRFSISITADEKKKLSSMNNSTLLSPAECRTDWQLSHIYASYSYNIWRRPLLRRVFTIFFRLVTEIKPYKNEYDVLRFSNRFKDVINCLTFLWTAVRTVRIKALRRRQHFIRNRLVYELLTRDSRGTVSFQTQSRDGLKHSL